MCSKRMNKNKHIIKTLSKNFMFYFPEKQINIWLHLHGLDQQKKTLKINLSFCVCLSLYLQIFALVFDVKFLNGILKFADFHLNKNVKCHHGKFSTIFWLKDFSVLFSIF
jgi:hypothetical protein